MDELLKMITENTQRSKSNTHRLDELTKRVEQQEELVKNVSILTNEMKHVNTALDEVRDDVKALLNEPSLKWKTFTSKLFWLIIGGLIVFAIYAMTGVKL